MSEKIQPEKKEFELTGKHVFAIVISAFSIVIGVNLVMAYVAIDTFPGLETANSYVASQEFDAQKAAQDALEWEVEVKALDETLRLEIRDRNGTPVEVGSIYGLLGRATHVKEDQEPDFIQTTSGAYAAKITPLGQGNWNLRLNVVAQNGTHFQRRIPIYVARK